MRRATITLPDDLASEVDAYIDGQKAAPSLTSVVQAALRQFLHLQRLARFEYRPPEGPLVVTPAAKGSGSSDVSEEHDRYFVGD